MVTTFLLVCVYPVQTQSSLALTAVTQQFAKVVRMAILSTQASIVKHARLLCRLVSVVRRAQIAFTAWPDIMLQVDHVFYALECCLDVFNAQELQLAFSVKVDTT